MKNSNNKKNSTVDLSTITISATLHQPQLIKTLVENLAYRCNSFDYSLEKMQPGWEAIDTSTVETFVSGDNSISSEAEHIYQPFFTSFLFTCKKEKGMDYNLAWAISLS